MLDNAFEGGSKKYWGLIGFWIVLILMGLFAYSSQLINGLTVTGMSRDVSWGFYIAQFTFLVGVAASAVMVVIPCYLHNYKAFKRTVILGEFLAVSAVLMCMLFIFVDMGQPMRVLNMFLHPTPNSPMFWDSMVLFGYLIINLLVGWVTFEAERKGAPAPEWIKPIIYLSIPWAVSIHTVTAFLYAGLEGRHFWLTAVLAPRFLASAFASGPSLLIVLALILRKYTKFDVGEESIRTLSKVVTYAIVTNIFLVACELFTALFSDIPVHVHHFQYMFFGLEGKTRLVGWMWTSQIMVVVAALLMVMPKIRNNLGLLGPICTMIIIAIWIDKGMGMVVTGFVPSPLEHVVEYAPTTTEIGVTIGVYSIGFLVLTILYKVVVTVRERLEIH